MNRNLLRTSQVVHAMWSGPGRSQRRTADGRRSGNSSGQRHSADRIALRGRRPDQVLGLCPQSDTPQPLPDRRPRRGQSARRPRPCARLCRKLGEAPARRAVALICSVSPIFLPSYRRAKEFTVQLSGHSAHSGTLSCLSLPRTFHVLVRFYRISPSFPLTRVYHLAQRVLQVTSSLLLRIFYSRLIIMDWFSRTTGWAVARFPKPFRWYELIYDLIWFAICEIVVNEILPSVSLPLLLCNDPESKSSITGFSLHAVKL